MAKVELGDEVIDTVTGFKGTAVGRTIWLHGCDRIVVQPKVKKDGALGGNETFDEPQLKVTKPKRVPQGSRNTGGPRANAAQRETPDR